MQQNETKKTYPEEGENGDYLFSEINNPDFEKTMGSAIAEIMANHSDEQELVEKSTIPLQLGFPPIPDIATLEYYDWVDDVISKAGLVFEGNQPPGTKMIGRSAELRLYSTLQEAVQSYLETLDGTETQQDVVDSVREVISRWTEVNIPLMNRTFEELFKRGLQAGVVAVGQQLDMGDEKVLELLRESELKIGSRIVLFSEDIANRYEKVVARNFGPTEEYNLPAMIRQLDEVAPARRFELERIARTEVGQTSGIGRFWAWAKEPEDLYYYQYNWNSTPDTRRRKMKELRQSWNPLTWDEAWFLWSNNKQMVDGKWQLGSINCRCTVSRTPVDDEYTGNRFAGRENMFERTLDVQMPWESSINT